MAFGMKEWIGVTLVGCALVAAWRLPPEPAPLRDAEVRTAEEIRYEALRAEERVTAEILYRMLWSDSLSAAVLAQANGGVAVLTPPGSEGAEAQRRRFHAHVLEQVRDLDAPSTSMVFGYVFQPNDHARDAGPFAGRDRTETYVGTRDGTDYCLQVRVVHADYVHRALAQRVADSDRTPPYSDDLGPCRFYLRYGLAGGPIQNWMERGGVELALETGAFIPSADPWTSGRRGPFGFTFLGNHTSLQVTRCLAGESGSCAELFENADGTYLLTPRQVEIARRSPATGVGTRFGFPLWFDDQVYIVADLEEEFGTEAFRAFWTSERPVAEAFEAAFGVDMGTWMVSWVHRTMGVDRPGPGLPRSASTGAALTVGVLLGIAWLRRRERGVTA